MEHKTMAQNKSINRYHKVQIVTDKHCMCELVLQTLNAL